MAGSIRSECLKKQTIGVGTENNLVAVNKKIAEIKKKIQLSEGQRKAYYEESNNATKHTSDQINHLKKEIKRLGDELVKAKKELGGEQNFRLIKYLHELGPISNKDHKLLKDNLDLKVIDLHKQLDLMRYKRNSKKHALEKLEIEYQTLFTDSSKIKPNKKKKPKISRKKITKLENDIHRISVQLMEARHIRKKYIGIRHSLLTDSIKFESALAKVEKMINQQNEEIYKLQEINKSAMQMRDKTMNSLLQFESKATDASGVREKQLVNFKNKVEDRKSELEKLEKRIFPTARPTLVHQESTESGELAPVDEENGSSLGANNMDDIFYKLMKATGVSDPECVFEKFKNQKATTERLIYLKNTMEEEKKNLESEQNIMLAEIEAYRFAQVKDKEENVEEVENLKLDIVNETKCQEEHTTEKMKVLYILLDIKRSFYDCSLKLEDADDAKIPDWSEDIVNLNDILQLLKAKFSAALDMVEKPETVVTVEEYLSPKPEDERRRSREMTPMTKTPGDESHALPTPYQEIMAPRTKSRGAGTPSGGQPKAAVSDEEEEIPSRGFLKRQAQLIVDAKSRRKGYKVPTPKK